MAATLRARAPARIQYGNRWSPRSGESEEGGSESSKKNSSYLRSSAPKCEAGKLTLLKKEDREWSDQDPGHLRQPPTRNGKRKCPHHKEPLLSVSPAHLLTLLTRKTSLRIENLSSNATPADGYLNSFSVSHPPQWPWLGYQTAIYHQIKEGVCHTVALSFTLKSILR
jgi:hypothetical protein